VLRDWQDAGGDREEFRKRLRKRLVRSGIVKVRRRDAELAENLDLMFPNRGQANTDRRLSLR